MITPEIDAVLAELAAFGQANDAAVAEPSRRMLNLDRATAELVAVIATAAGARRAVEVGTSNGYSTIWLAAHVGQVVTIDRDPAKHELARANLRRAGLLDRVTLVTADATGIVAAVDGPVDLVLFDADRRSAAGQLAAVLPKLSRRCTVLHDNAVSHRGELAEYLALVGQLPGFAHTVVPVGKGLSVAGRSA